MALSLATAKALCAANAQTGLVATDPRLADQIGQAMARLIRYRNAFVRREEYDATPITYSSSTDPLQLDEPDALKLMVLALWREENDKLDLAGALEQRANSLVAQNIVAAFEAANKAAYLTAVAGTANTRTWYAARLGLDTAGGLATSTAKLKRYVSRAASWIYQKYYEFQLIERNRVHSGLPTLAVQPVLDTDVFSPVLDYETIRLVVQALALESSAVNNEALGANNQGAALAAQCLAEALGLIARKLQAELEALRHGAYATVLAATTANTFGQYKASLALEMPNGIKLSDSEIGRLCNAAERRLVECGKWKGLVADFEIAITSTGETNMPPEVEAVLGATICNVPQLIKPQWYEISEGGQGRLNDDHRGVGDILVRRPGDYTVDGQTVARYFVTGCSREGQTLKVRAKRRFLVKSSDGTAMQVKNFGALKAAAQCLMHEGFCGQEIAGVPQRDPGLSAYYWNLAKKILDDELSENMGGEQPAIQVQVSGGFGAGDIYCPL